MDLYRDDAPDWRWRRARAERMMELEGNSLVPSTDPLIRSSKRFLEMWEDPDKRAECRELMPEMAFLVDINNQHSQGCCRHALEAAVLAEAKAGFVTRNIHRGFNAFLLAMYEALFFDVRDRLDAPFWVEREIFVPAASGKTIVSDIVWKVVGYAGGEDRLLSDCLRGSVYSGNDMKWIVEAVLSENARSVLKHVHARGKVPMEVEAQHVSRTITDWTDRISRLRELEDGGSDGGAIPDEFDLTRRIRLTPPDEEPVEVEALPECVVKYSDEEFDDD